MHAKKMLPKIFGEGECFAASGFRADIKFLESMNRLIIPYQMGSIDKIFPHSLQTNFFVRLSGTRFLRAFISSVSYPRQTITIASHDIIPKLKALIVFILTG